MESHFAEFSSSYHCNREADCQSCQRSRKRIANSLIDGHLTELLSGQTDGAKDAVFPLSGHLIGEGGVDEIDHAKEEHQPGQRLKTSKNDPVFHFLIILMYPNGIQVKIRIGRNDRTQTVFNLLRLLGIADNAPGIIKTIDHRHCFLKQFFGCNHAGAVQCQRTMTIFKPIVYEQTGNSDRNLLIPYGKFDN